jgi:hypothetical protein
MTMVRSILVALGAALGLFAFAALGELPLGAILRAAAGVVLGVGVAALAYGEATFAAVTVGAISPLAFAATEGTSLAGAAAAMCALWLAPSFVLADTRRKLAVLVAVSLAAAAVAGWIFASYVAAPLAAHAASCVFAGSCLSLVGIVVPLPSPTAHALRTAAAIIDGTTRDALVAAASAFESTRWQPRTSVEARRWRSLVRLSDRRAALARASGVRAGELRRDLDAQIATVSLELSPSTAKAAEQEATTTEAAPTEGVAPSPEIASAAPDAVDATIEKIEKGETLVEESR